MICTFTAGMQGIAHPGINKKSFFRIRTVENAAVLSPTTEENSPEARMTLDKLAQKRGKQEREGTGHAH